MLSVKLLVNSTLFVKFGGVIHGFMTVQRVGAPAPMLFKLTCIQK